MVSSRAFISTSVYGRPYRRLFSRLSRACVALRGNARLSWLCLDPRRAHGLSGGARDDRRSASLRLAIRNIPEHRLASWNPFERRGAGASVHPRSEGRHTDEAPRLPRTARNSAERCSCNGVHLRRHLDLSEPVGSRQRGLRRGHTICRALAAERPDDPLRIAAAALAVTTENTALSTA